MARPPPHEWPRTSHRARPIASRSAGRSPASCSMRALRAPGGDLRCTATALVVEDELTALGERSESGPQQVVIEQQSAVHADERYRHRVLSGERYTANSSPRARTARRVRRGDAGRERRKAMKRSRGVICGRRRPRQDSDVHHISQQFPCAYRRLPMACRARPQRRNSLLRRPTEVVDEAREQDRDQRTGCPRSWAGAAGGALGSGDRQVRWSPTWVSPATDDCDCAAGVADGSAAAGGWSASSKMALMASVADSAGVGAIGVASVARTHSVNCLNICLFTLSIIPRPNCAMRPTMSMSATTRTSVAAACEPRTTDARHRHLR